MYLSALNLQAIIRILKHLQALKKHNEVCRKDITKSDFMQNLTNDLKNKLHSHFESICVGLLQDESEFGVESLRRVIEGSCR